MPNEEIEPLLVPLKTAARLLGYCRQTLYRMRDDGQIAFGRMRGRVMVPMAEIKRVTDLLSTNYEKEKQKPRPLQSAGALSKEDRALSLTVAKATLEAQKERLRKGKRQRKKLP